MMMIMVMMAILAHVLDRQETEMGASSRTSLTPSRLLHTQIRLRMELHLSHPRFVKKRVQDWKRIRLKNAVPFALLNGNVAIGSGACHAGTSSTSLALIPGFRPIQVALSVDTICDHSRKLWHCHEVIMNDCYQAYSGGCCATQPDGC